MPLPPSSSTAPGPTLTDLKKAFGLLEKANAAKQDNISAWLAHKEPVTQEEEDWFDGTGNLVDERLLIDTLEQASDFRAGLTNLNQQQSAALV